jgi:hypothetical protein
MTPEQWHQVHERWSAIVSAMVAAGIPRDELSILAIMTGAHHLSERLGGTDERVRRPIGFAPPARKAR